MKKTTPKKEPKQERPPKPPLPKWKRDESIVKTKKIGEYEYTALINPNNKAYNNVQLKIEKDDIAISYLKENYVRVLWFWIFDIHFTIGTIYQTHGGCINTFRVMQKQDNLHWIFTPFSNKGNQSYFAFKSYEDMKTLYDFLIECFNYTA